MAEVLLRTDIRVLPHSPQNLIKTSAQEKGSYDVLLHEISKIVPQVIRVSAKSGSYCGFCSVLRRMKATNGSPFKWHFLSHVSGDELSEDYVGTVLEKVWGVK